MCVCVCWQKALNLSGVWICLSVCLTHTLHGYIYTQHLMSGPKDPIDDRRIIYRWQSVRRISKYFEGFHILRSSTVALVTYLSMSSKDRYYPSMNYPTTQNIFNQYSNCWPSQTRRTVDLVKLTWLTRTSFTSWSNTDKVQTQVHQQTPPWL